jgi:hypothetical protein
VSPRTAAVALRLGGRLVGGIPLAVSVDPSTASRDPVSTRSGASGDDVEATPEVAREAVPRRSVRRSPLGNAVVSGRVSLRAR